MTEGGAMSGFDATGPSGYGPTTGGRRGYCGEGDAAATSYGRGRGRRNMYRLTGLTGWERAARAETPRAEQEDLAASLARINSSLTEVLQRLERLEAARGD